MKQPHLHYFQPTEFRGWWKKMSPRLLVLLDSCRSQWGAPIRVSPADRALGRRMGESLSQHNVQKWGEVRAVDVFPANVETIDEAERFYALARRVGFTGIGIYPDTKPGVMFHLDVRIDVVPGTPATWGGLRRMVAAPEQQNDWRYVSLDEALREVG
jgi:hypothetical protein